MAGDWLKMDANTPDKPEVLAITVKLGWDDPDLTVGKLFRVWRWFDQQTLDGNAAGVTCALLDRIAGVSGFAAAMASVGWLEVTEAGVSLPKFDRHNGATAKQRALTAKRVASHRCNAISNADSNAPVVTPPLAREEKRRTSSSLRSEDDSRAVRSVSILDLQSDGLTQQTAEEWLIHRQRKKAKLTPRAWEGVKAEAAKAGLSNEDAVCKAMARGWTGFEAAWVTDRQGPGPPASRHAGFATKNYRDGVTEDGSFA